MVSQVHAAPGSRHFGPYGPSRLERFSVLRFLNAFLPLPFFTHFCETPNCPNRILLDPISTVHSLSKPISRVFIPQNPNFNFASSFPRDKYSPPQSAQNLCGPFSLRFSLTELSLLHLKFSRKNERETQTLTLILSARIFSSPGTLLSLHFYAFP